MDTLTRRGAHLGGGPLHRILKSACHATGRWRFGKAAKDFTGFIGSRQLTANQIEFVNLIDE